ncbi:xanthine dehydrogenase molybdopterin binding subunit [Ramlibacter tataouinensis]|uniref:Candidate xanthine dehydrogenase large subunit n=1 Tax=Ramlibacter tataouinensis (strain ATCC BAA-407 / DSM 14655 / LMG 21543 / TTB310) TaxID=365046 RepID=F5XY26_RAMTT|nr:xanthine dehydrogenase molybdopterin binding subunit [Ramlibacter tataouinensis]AEG94351.1 Candidate xanthine dehydrogenase large subunit [Ramlibacter tataouinensis TTB310]
MNAREKEFTSASGGGPAGPADAGERNLAPATQSPHAPASPAPAVGSSRPHESARAQVAGLATYIDDLPELKGTLHAAPILSPVAHGRLRSVDARAALQLPGVRGVVLAADIPGDPVLATFVHDEPIFARDTVQHAGQVIGLVVAESVMEARRAARQVRLDIEALPAVLDVRQAHAARSYVLPPVTVRRGEPEAALARSPHRLSGRLEVGGQEHFYLEGQVAYAIPLEQDQWHIHSSTQHPGEVQHWVAHALGLENNAVTVECRRMGGGFGGKETQAGHMAVWAALAARKLRRPVKLRLDRDDDFMVTGKRHPFAYDWEVGFDGGGRITGLKLAMLANCGFSADLSGPVADRAIFHTDNAYFLSDVEIASYRCRTNVQSHTAFRGFGGPQGVILIEAILGDIARHLALDPLDVRMRNLYGAGDGRDVTHYRMKVEDNILQPLLSRLEQSSQYRRRRQAIAAWNAGSSVIKRGIAITPVKFGISFTATFFNQAGALVHVFTDGSVQLNHGGTEMGQGLHTKIMQLVADELGVPFERVRVTATETGKVPNASATAASSGTDLNGRAAQFAARNIKGNLAAFVAGLDGCGAGAVSFQAGQVVSPKQTRSFDQVVKLAYANRIQLWSDGFYRTPKIHYDKVTLTGRPFYYFSYGAACSEVAIDALTGESRVLAVDILHDVGHSINPALDIGQIEGGFIQGMGWLTTEQLVWNARGELATHAPSTYKIPATGDLPARWQVELWPEPNPEDNVGRSKAVGEPPFMLAISVWEAIRDAVAAGGGEPRALAAPATAEQVLRALGDGPASGTTPG